jgi:hypothetical protein
MRYANVSEGQTMFLFFNKRFIAWILGSTSLIGGYVLYQTPVFAKKWDSNFVLLAAQPQTKSTHRIKFPPGSTSTVIKSSVRLGKKDTYIFHARKGQTIIADITWNGTRVGGNKNDQGLSGFTFVEPGGESISNPQNAQFPATATGDYQVIIAQPYQLTSPAYTFKLTVR